MIEPAQKTAPPTSAGSPERRIAVSFRKSYARRVREGFMERYLSGAHILDVGFRGGKLVLFLTPKSLRQGSGE